MSADTSTQSNTKELATKIIYFTSLATLSVIIGFSTTIGKMNNHGNKTQEAKVYEDGVALARRALLRGTAYSVGGFGICFLAGISVNKIYKHYFTKHEHE